MQHSIARALLLALLIGIPSSAAAQTSSEGGRLSLVVNPQVMVYLDGHRVGFSPLLNHRLDAGDHEMALLLVLPNGNRLRANYRVQIAAGQETVATLDLVHNAPAEGEVRTLGPASAASPRAAQNPPATGPQVSNPPVTNPPAQEPTPGSWATNPGHPSTAPVTVAPPPPPPPQPPPPPPPPPPEETHALSRELVREGLEALRPIVQRCMEGRSGVVQVRMVIQPDGGVTDVEAQGVYRGTNAGECIARAIPEEAAFPIYTGDPIPVVYPYRIMDQ